MNATTDNGTVYIIDPQTGAASVVGTAGLVAFVTTAGAVVDLPPVSAGYGFDFNPTVDRIRVVTGSGLNFRVNPNNGAPVDNNANAADGTNPDGGINGGPAGSTGVTAAAYTNSFGQSLTGGVTTQYVIDATSNSLFIQNPPNNGTLTAAQTITLNGDDVGLHRSEWLRYSRERASDDIRVAGDGLGLRGTDGRLRDALVFDRSE